MNSVGPNAPSPPSMAVAVGALIIAILAAILGGFSIWEDYHLRKAMAVETQVQVYLADHAALRSSYDNAGFSEDSYFDCDDYDLRLKANTAAAALLSTIETMKEAGDPRADNWARFLAGYPGPIEDFGLLDGYVRTSWGKQKLAEARASTPWKHYPKCLEPSITRLPSAVPKGASVN